jgi:hypothetical protein
LRHVTRRKHGHAKIRWQGEVSDQRECERVVTEVIWTDPASDERKGDKTDRLTGGLGYGKQK